MRRLSKIQFNRAIEGKPIMTTEAGPPPSAPNKSPNKSNRSSRMMITALVVVFGIGAGWIGGKVLSRRMSNPSAAAPASDASAGDRSTALSPPPSPQSQPASKRTSAEAASPSESANESEQPVVASEPRARESEPKDAPREAPPKTPKVDKDDGPETPTAEDPAKEIGRQAVKKMLKEVKRMQRGLANKNENENRH